MPPYFRDEDFVPQDFYELLQVHEKASVEVIEAAHRRLSRIYHPESGTAPDAALMARLNHAKDVLIDPEQRVPYDAELRTRRARSAGPESGQQHSSQGDSAGSRSESEQESPRQERREGRPSPPKLDVEPLTVSINAMSVSQRVTFPVRVRNLGGPYDPKTFRVRTPRHPAHPAPDPQSWLSLQQEPQGSPSLEPLELTLVIDTHGLHPNQYYQAQVFIDLAGQEAQVVVAINTMVSAAAAASRRLWLVGASAAVLVLLLLSVLVLSKSGSSPSNHQIAGAGAAAATVTRTSSNPTGNAGQPTVTRTPSPSTVPTAVPTVAPTPIQIQITPALAVGTGLPASPVPTKGMGRVQVTVPGVGHAIDGSDFIISKPLKDANGATITGETVVEFHTDKTGIATADIQPGQYLIRSTNLPGDSWGDAQRGKGYDGLTVVAGQTISLTITLGKLTVVFRKQNGDIINGQLVLVYGQATDANGKITTSNDEIGQGGTGPTGWSTDVAPGKYIVILGGEGGPVLGTINNVEVNPGQVQTVNFQENSLGGATATTATAIPTSSPTAAAIPLAPPSGLAMRLVS
jgi:hypothetical protein